MYIFQDHGLTITLIYPSFFKNQFLASQNRPKAPPFQIGISIVVYVKRTDPDINAELTPIPFTKPGLYEPQVISITY